MNTALLVMDTQEFTFAHVGEEAPALLRRTAQAIATARAANVKIIYVCLSFRPGYPEISPANVMFSGLKQSGMFTGALGSDIPAEIAPQEGDLLVAKHRVSAFSGNGLEMILRANGITKLVCLGIATSGIVLSTVRQAMDLDYQLVVVRDCCADTDPEVHRVLCDKVFARHAKVVDVAELAAAL
jgi:nicotinamidase-related amidase